ncbi:MAG: TIGR03084 family metal-binding protein [Actinomycetota bacterium]
MADIHTLCRDLRDEHGALDRIVGEIAGPAWDIMTPAEPWTVRDQIAHLSFFDRAAHLAVTDPGGFAAELQQAATDIEAYMNAPLQQAREQEPDEVLDTWRQRRREMLGAFATVAPASRIPWYGPPMSPASFISARLMETWAHGQDIVDALGIERDATDRLYHVAHLGVRARPFSYVAHSRPLPEGDVRVVLTSPGGETWEWGTGDDNVVSGSALGFCLVVTQRRHPADVDLRAIGPLAQEWMSIAQCFAGPPGAGRHPGQFPALSN